jgi:anti-sigma factor RsiW
MTAYLDGVAELSPEERKRVEAVLAEDPEAQAEATATRDLLGQLRALPAVSDGGQDPDWTQLERQIRGAVAADVPYVWWRRLRWWLPAGVLAAAAVVVVVAVRPGEPRAPVALRDHDAGEPALRAPPTAEAEATGAAVWLDGQAVEVGDIDPGVLYDDDGSDALAEDSELLPTSDLRWIDGLDERALDRAEHWLDHAKGHEKG